MEAMSNSLPALRIGHGYDLHRLEACAPAGRGRPFVLAGVVFDHPVGPVGHSDGDAVYHAVYDALMGAIGREDIGQAFPDTDPAWDGQDSAHFLRAARSVLAEAGYAIVNLDVTVICERPKLSPRKVEMIANIASLLAIEPARVNLKGKTHEKVDAVGEGRAVEVHVVALVARSDGMPGGVSGVL
jgi:2-C-methyl-D-erythritol 2,4-cyclodiphosphate synthase